MNKTAQQKIPLEREVDHLVADGYTPIHPDHNAINLILTELGKADLPPREVEALCQTAKVVGLNGFTRVDLLPCGCSRIYKGLILGHHQDPRNLTIRIGGIEGVKPCPKHTELIEATKLCITTR